MERLKPGKLGIYKLRSQDPIPFDLLLLADETREAIKKYIFNSELYLVFGLAQRIPIGVFALALNDAAIEIKNLAIREEYRGLGIGNKIISKIRNIARDRNCTQITVGTADASKKAIQFYERNGFVKYDVIKNFYLENYPAPIYEDGDLLRDMIMLKLSVAEQTTT